MLTYFLIGAGITFVPCLLVMIALYLRNRKIVCFAPRGSMVSKAMQDHYRPSLLSYQVYARKASKSLPPV